MGDSNSNFDSNKNSPAKLVFGDSTSQVNTDNQGEESPKIVTEEKLKCYDKFKNIPIIVEGPEQS